ncbi:MAG: YjbQ family protein [Anaerolineae bacterium]|nr:YjbQ family protein [Anaerolineae bacterium]
MRIIEVETTARSQLVDVTRQVAEVLAEEGSERDGVCHVFVLHTTAGITVNENADPSVGRDLLAHLDRLVPWDGRYAHSEGNSAAHIKASLLGSSVSVPVRGGRLVLGTWQGIFLAEFDGPRRRRLGIQLVQGSP